MFRAFFVLTLLTNLNADPGAFNGYVDNSQWQAASLLETPVLPVKDQSFIAPIIGASGALAIDVDTGEILFDQNPHQILAIASLTKVMTAIVILEENDLDEIVTVGTNAAEIQGSRAYLRVGEKIKVSELIKALLVNSSNDAAVALAEHNAASVENFVKKMNLKAESLGLNNTHFSNPIGLDSVDNYSTAHDVAVMGRYLYRKPIIKDIVDIKETTVYSVNGISHNLVNTNKLLGNYLNIKGIKTGSTEEAGLCLMAIGSNQQGKEVLSVVLGSPDRFTETKVMIDWAFRAYKW